MKVPALVGMMRGSGRGRCFGFRREVSPSNLTVSSSAWRRKRSREAQPLGCPQKPGALTGACRCRLRHDLPAVPTKMRRAPKPSLLSPPGRFRLATCTSGPA